ncbi:putative vacuolar protein sorting-associated protein [Septoria linicola]|nr:putative vacuolar protein sorting-associated protein [Septoria linicola]
MSWWQKKLLRYGLRYGLSRTGLLDDTAIDLDNLDITVGRQNVIELKDVGLNIQRITQLAQLPPALRLETARVLHLKLTIPADFYQSSIVVEVDGVEVVAKFDENQHEQAKHKKQSRSRSRSPATVRTPQHRKANRRIHSPPPYDPGGPDRGARLPNVQDVAKSFLFDEPMNERRELEALACGNNTIEDSFTSESSEGDAGIGTGIGVPGFLTIFLQGIVERFQLKVSNVEVRIEIGVPGDDLQSLPVALRLRTRAVGIDQVDQSEPSKARKVTLDNIAIDLLTKDEVIADLSSIPSRSSTADQKSSSSSSPAEIDQSLVAARTTTDPVAESVVLSRKRPSMDSADSDNDMMQSAMEPSFLPSNVTPSRRHRPAAFESTTVAEQLAGAYGDDLEGPAGSEPRDHDFDIQPGDDNISWGSRRSKASAPANDLWNSMVSDDDLPNSLLFAQPTLSAHTRGSRSSSQLSLRQRRAVSPYDRGIPSPGSWPRPEESHPIHRHQGPGSWPTIHQDPHIKVEPLDQLLASSSDRVVDNKVVALEQARPMSPEAEPPTPPEDMAVMDDSMLESRVFSHEEAQSMYMSAMTGSPTPNMPGGWGSDTQSIQSIPRENSNTSRSVSEVDQRQSMAQLDGAQASVEISPGNDTPTAQTPTLPNEPLEAESTSEQFAIRQLLHIDQVTISLPSQPPSADVNESSHPSRSNRKPSDARSSRVMPGTFSAYSDLGASRRYGASSVQAAGSRGFQEPEDTAFLPRAASPVVITLATVAAQLDVSTVQLLYKVSSSVTNVMQNESQSDHEEISTDPAEQNLSAVTFRLQRLHVQLTERINPGHILADLSSMSTHGLLDFALLDMNVSMAASTVLHIGDLEVLLGGQELLKFDNAASPMAESMALTEEAPAISLDVTKNTLAMKRKSVMEITLQTKPVRLGLDLGVFDDTFNTFGGISGILELGSSVLTDSGILSPALSAPPKGVRFAGEPETVRLTNEIKANAHLGGITTTLSSSACAVTLRTSTIKSVYRKSGVSATISRVVIRGPYCGSQTQDPPLTIDFANIRVEYLLAPQDSDLERLLSLLTPSRDQYDDDGDILIDTLLRQRRKGALLRLSLGNVRVKLETFDCIPTLSRLGDDLAKLSAVTKYLPEDDKPGLLTLIRIKDAEARVPVNDRLGSVLCALQDLHLAHVGLPSLLAFSIGDLFARQTRGSELLHSLLPLTGADGLPVVMARMIGNEIEPTIKIKLFNLCFEYSVPVLLALTGMDEHSDPEEIVNDIAQSIANLAMARDHRRLSRSPTSDSPGGTTKKMAISLLVHDSAIGLTPQELSSRALIVLNDTHMVTTVPAGDNMALKLEIRKAGIFITDHVVDETNSSPVPSSSDTVLRLSNALSQRGFVSVGSVRSAEVQFRAREGMGDGSSKTVEVDIRNELFLLETCADSTQTLFATLGALAPPSLPNKEPKYLTQPMPIEDIMASFSGDPFVQPEEKPEMLFDVEHDPDDIDPEDLLGVSTFEDADDLLAESEITSSLYGPVNGLLGVDKDEEVDTVDNYPETAESLLEEDPFEMTISPEDAHLGDAALMRDLNRQCQSAASSEPIDLGLYEIEDLGFDALGSGQQALGAQHRFNAPFVGKRGVGLNRSHPDLPFHLRLRDFNFIWHLHDGYDWQRTRDGIVDAVEQVEQRAEERKARRRRSRQDPEDEESVIGDFLFNSIYIGVPADLDTQDIRRQINRGIDQDISETESIPVSGISRPTTYSASGQPRHRQSQRRRLKIGRSRSHKIAFELKSVSADVSVFPPGSDGVVSSVDLRVKDFEIFDKVPTSTWRKFLTHLDNDPASREMSKPMFHIQLDNVKTLESHSASEIVLHVTVLPLRLHVDQDALDFITRFFEFKDPAMVTKPDPGEKPFIQRVEVDTVDLCLDYKPKSVDYAGLRSGRTKEFMNFITLEGCNIRLKHAIIYGLQGFDLLHDTLSDVWTPDVIRNQLPRVLSGLAPVRSLVNLGVGMRDVVAIPVREYKKDGRIVRSIQKGAFHFGKTTAAELARLGAKVALGTQTMLSNAEELLAPGSSAAGQSRLSSSPNWHEPGHISENDDTERQRAVSAYANQPLGVLSGLRSARRHLEHDLLTAKDALIAVQGEVLESRGPGDVAGAVVKHAPTVILRPVIGATRAVGTALLGVGNAVDRGNLRRVEDKYKRR